MVWVVPTLSLKNHVFPRVCRYDLFPITVEIKERRRSVGHFLTRVCAVVGGVFAVSGMLDRGVHAAITFLCPKR